MATSLVISRRSAPNTQVLRHNLGLGRSKSTANGPPLAPTAKPRLSSGHLVPLELMHAVQSGGIGFNPIRKDGLSLRSTTQQSPTYGMVDPRFPRAGTVKPVPHVRGREGSTWAACPQRAGVFPAELGVVRLCQ